MAFTFTERTDSGASTSSPPSVTLKYTAAGSSDRAFVKAAAFTYTAPTVAVAEGLLYRQDIQVEPEGFNLFRVTVPYAPRSRETGSLRFSISSQGGTFNIKTSRSTVARYPGTAKDHKQLIGVNGDQVEGADIIIPATKLTISLKHPAAGFSLPAAFALADLTGRVNDGTFLTRPAGSMLFLGLDGSDGTDAEAEVSYHYAYEPNLSDLVIGTITDIEKDGHDLLWVTWKDNDADGKPGREPLGVYVERVYDRMDFPTAFGFGGS